MFVTVSLHLPRVLALGGCLAMFVKLMVMTIPHSGSGRIEAGYFSIS